MEDDELWSADPDLLRNTEWEKISSDFTNAGYREGITAGKEGALQEGFDDGFAQVGAPIGRELGILRGIASALLAILASPHRIPTGPTPEQNDALTNEVRAIAMQLSDVRLSDIAPPDLEALRHAQEHLGDEDAADLADPARLNEELKDKRDVEILEDLMTRMNAGGSSVGAPPAAPSRPTLEDVRKLGERLKAISEGLGLPLQWS